MNKSVVVVTNHPGDGCTTASALNNVKADEVPSASPDSPPLRALPELKELYIELSDPREQKYDASEPSPFRNLCTNLGIALTTTRFEKHLTSLNLTAPSADDLASLVQSVPPSLCANLKSFFRRLSYLIYLHDDFGSPKYRYLTDTLNAFVAKCPHLRSLSLPYLNKRLRLHPDNDAGLRKLVVPFEDTGHQQANDSDTMRLYLELFPVLMAKGAATVPAHVELWTQSWRCKFVVCTRPSVLYKVREC